MKKIFSLLAFVFFIVAELNAQTVTLAPTITPAQFRYNDQITVTYDVTGTLMEPLSDAWVWVWIPNTNIGATYDINPATSAADPAKCTKSTASGKTFFSITFKPSDFFSSDISTQTQMGILLKGPNWPPAFPQTTDYLTSFWDGTFQVKITSPTAQPLFVANGGTIQIQATAPITADYKLYLNNKLIDTKAAQPSYSYNLIANDSIAFYTVKVEATASSITSSATFNYNIRQSSPALARPAGIIDGINYNPSDQTKATLCFWAPNKTSVYAFGDFTDWNIDPKYLMNKDGERFWVEITGLTPGTEYAFQYLVNDTLRIADPYTDKILEQDDNQIPATTYPGLKTIPAKAISPQWYYNHFSVLQTGQTPYQWQTTGYVKPAKEKLIIYELLIRDFFDASHRNFQSLIDTISYFKHLGVNAIELMPVAEFNGEIGWGYNPTSMFAIQKYYGHKNKLKEFVDKCHANGIAVIMDLVMNHQDLPNAYCMLDYDFANNHPKATNKWFNVSAPHPYSVFNDLNHNSTYTRKYLDTINYYWVNEFKIDGYRYDLSKGFTQTVSTEATVSNYDASRVFNLERMADKLWQNFPDAYIILEHFADNNEETTLANYRAGEGKGMMLWGNLNYAYGQNTMGISSGSDISWIYHGTRGWSAPRAVGYMESHDEEREMYRNLNFGASNGSYNVRTLSTALERMKTAAAFFYPIPGPKMLWEFGELGYDYSINTCTDGSVNNNCRLSEKPVHWDYLADVQRKKLFKVTSALMKLRNTYPVFQTSNFSLQGGGSLVKQMILKGNPYVANPSSTDEMNAVVVGNFDVVVQSISANFPHTGNWFNYFSQGDTLVVSTTPQSVSLQPGQFIIFTDVKLPATEPELSVYAKPLPPKLKVVQQSGLAIQLTWTDSSAIESGFNIYRRKAGQSFAKVGQVTANTTTYQDTQSLESSTHYDYYVEAFNSAAASRSNSKFVVTDFTAQTPVITSAVQHLNAVRVTWIDNSAQETGYKIYRRVTGQAFSLVGTVTENTTVYSDAQDLQSNTQYDYYVELYTSSISLQSGVTSVTTTTITEITAFNGAGVVYPNPASRVINIDRNLEVEELHLLSMQGMRIQISRLDHFTWSVEDVSNGFYIVEYRTADGTFRTKLIKN